jgi:hypothetical protein
MGMADKTTRMALNNARTTWAATHGMLCFSSDWSDPVIWAHYSDKHRGVCLGFEIPDVYGTKVNYIDDRLHLNSVMLQHGFSCRSIQMKPVVQPARSSLLFGIAICQVLALALLVFLIAPAFGRH